MPINAPWTYPTLMRTPPGGAGGRRLLGLRELRLPTGISQRQVEPLLILAVPPLQCILGWVTQLTDGRAGAFAELDVQLNGSDSVFVGIHELPSSSPSFRPHPPLRLHKRSCTQTAREVVFYAACGLGCR